MSHFEIGPLFAAQVPIGGRIREFENMQTMDQAGTIDPCHYIS